MRLRLAAVTILAGLVALAGGASGAQATRADAPPPREADDEVVWDPATLPGGREGASYTVAISATLKGGEDPVKGFLAGAPFCGTSSPVTL